MGSNRRLNCRPMARHQGPVLVDTNVVIESHRVAAWRALTGGYRVETVEECVSETQIGAELTRINEAKPHSLPPQSQRVPAPLDHQAHLVQDVAPEEGIVPSLRPEWTALCDADANAEGELSTVVFSVRQ